jgi:Dyp-type peroxidase family
MEANTSMDEAAPILELDEIQGNIAGFNKDHQRFVFLRFPSREAAQGFLRVTIREVDTCDDVARFNRSFRRAKASQGRRSLPTARWFNLALSSFGLQLIGPPDLDSLPQEFKDGMKARAATLGDVDVNAPDQWVPPFTDAIHAVALLAADVPEDLERLHKQLRRHLHPRAIDEMGQVDGETRPGDQRGHEHFGFKDGISQPGIAGLTDPKDLKSGQEMIAPGEFVLGYPKQGEEPPPPPPPSPYGPPPAPPPPLGPEWTRNGSYLVFRRLRQDVRGFNEFIRQAVNDTGLRPDILEAKLVGRYKTGAPLERTKDEAPDFDPQVADPSVADPSILFDEKINNFEYAPHDNDGLLVPRAAHIRKMYPRNQDPPGKQQAERRRILRRGIPYGPEFVESESPYPGSGNPPADQDRGLVFICYQASIEDQFEFIQTQWANHDDFPQAEDGRDPIIAQDVAEPAFRIPPRPERLNLQRWVITTGGEYFFSPSISALHFLSGSPPEELATDQSR